MDRLVGAARRVGFVRRLAFEPPEAAFDAAFSSSKDDDDRGHHGHGEQP